MTSRTTPHVTVVGSVNMDLVVRVDHLPEPGETVSGSPVEHRHGGKGANQAVAARRHGADVRFVGAVGDDAHGEQLARGLLAHGLDVALDRVPACPSGTALIVVDRHGQNTITVAPGANHRLSADDAASRLAGLASSQALLLQMEVLAAVSLAACELARQLGVRSVLNASPLPGVLDDATTRLVAACDVLVVNEGEAAQLLGRAPADWAEGAGGLLDLGPSAAVVTLGARGAVVATRHERSSQSGFQVDAVDGTGAGDSFCGALAVSLARGAGWAVALREACAAGAITATRVGAQAAAASTEEIAALIARREVLRAS